jgi:hypothetical protein
MKTAIEWYTSKLEELDIEVPYMVYAEAKEMEKEQHGNTWDTALDKYEVRAGNYMRAYEDFDDYYNETFKSNEQE